MLTRCKMFGAHFCRISSAFDWAAAWNVRLYSQGYVTRTYYRLTVQKQILKWAAKYTFRNPKMEKIRPIPRTSSPNGEGDIPSVSPTPHILSTSAAPLFLRLRLAIGRKPKSAMVPQMVIVGLLPSIASSSGFLYVGRFLWPAVCTPATYRPRPTYRCHFIFMHSKNNSRFRFSFS